MSVTLKNYPEAGTLKVTVSGKLNTEDYDRFIPLVEDLITQNDKLDLLVVLHDFRGWTAGALWEDIKFDAKHFNDISKLAIVGDSAWEAGMARFCKPFTSADVRFFPREQLAGAQEWTGISGPC
jgi:hypothetical protein